MIWAGFQIAIGFGLAILAWFAGFFVALFVFAGIMEIIGFVFKGVIKARNPLRAS